MVDKIFDEPKEEQQQQENTGGEFNYDNLSDTAVGDKMSYVRENLDGKETTIEKAQLFTADTTQKPITAMNDSSKQYYKCNFIVTYNLKNKDGLNHREYMSGAIQHVQRDGALSEPSMWYPGANNQVARLWEKVAKVKKVDPDKLSNREFMAYLNNKPKAKLEQVEIPFQGQTHKKNLVKEFI